MRDTYPKKSHYLKFDRTRDGIKMKHMLTEEEWIVSAQAARFIKSLDGKRNPYAAGYDQDLVEEILDFMEEELLFETGERKMKLGIGSVLFALWIPNVKIIHRIAGFFWNRLLMILWGPVFILGLYIALNESYARVNGEWWCVSVGVWGGLGIGIVLHEISHAAAALHYGGSLFEAGVILHHFMPGAYCMIDYANVKDRFRRAQINAAGIECNILLAGAFLCMLKLGWFDSDALLYAGGMNFFIAMFNLALIEGMDGNSLFEDFLGCDNFVARAKLVIFNPSCKRRLRSRGINGRAAIAACYLICGLQLLLPVVLLVNAVNVIGIFLING